METISFECHTWNGYNEFQVTNQMPEEGNDEYTFYQDGEIVLAIKSHEYDFYGWRHSVVIATNAPVTIVDIEDDTAMSQYYTATVQLPASLAEKLADIKA